MMEFRDLLCDRCLYLLETADKDGITVLDFCKRCREKLHDYLIEIATEMSRAEEDGGGLLEEPEP